VTVDQAAAQTDPTDKSPIKFTVTFSEPVFGFTASDVSFAGSTVGGTLAASVSGSGANYTITVTGMLPFPAGTIVVSVPAGGATDAAGNLNLASGGGDNSVFFFNDPPTSNAGGPYAVAEGASLSLHASGLDPDNDPLVFRWDVNGDDIFTDATGANVTLTWAQLMALGINDGPGSFQVRAQADDGFGHLVPSAPVTLTVNNTAPNAGVGGPSSGSRGQILNFVLAANDFSPIDQAAGFTYAINWGDGTPAQKINPTAGNGAGLSVSHAFTATGLFTVSVNATDKDGGVSTTAKSGTVNIVTAQVQGGVLRLGGTTKGDVIIISPGVGTDSVRVLVNGVAKTYSGVSRIEAYGQAGNDVIRVDSRVMIPAMIDGGEGNDQLQGGGGGDLLIGGGGADILVGGPGRNVLIGGAGADILRGGLDDDLEIGSTTAYDNDRVALELIREEWSRTDIDQPTRVDHLTNGGGKNGSIVLSTDPNNRTVFNDGKADVLFGNGALDWFLLGPGSAIADKKTNSTITLV
jgi:hypothetical protein